MSSRELTSPRRPCVSCFQSEKSCRIFFSFPNGSACLAFARGLRWKAGVSHAVKGRDVEAPSSETEACGGAGRSFGLRAETHGARGRGGR